MKFKRCDRCNEEIEEKRGVAQALDYLSDAAMKIAAAMGGKPYHEDELYREGNPADLCPACRKSLKEWLKAGAKSQHQNEEQEEEPNRNTKIVVAAIEDPIEPNKAVKFGDF